MIITKLQNSDTEQNKFTFVIIIGKRIFTDEVQKTFF